MKELVILSGKGGTGKTSLTASFASLAENVVIADCDVDAADLHLVLSPDIEYCEAFTSGHEAVIRNELCSACGTCIEYCRFNAIRYDEKNDLYSIDPTACEGCGVCTYFCPQQCIDFPDRKCGDWFISSTRVGPMVHAHLGIAAENSGKLVTKVRAEAKEVGQIQGADFLLIDGPPGIGCPAIASMAGADYLVLVTEPSLSGKHDIERVMKLARHFGVTSAVCVNKWDINPELSGQIEQLAIENGATFLGKIRYDSRVMKAQFVGKTVVEMGDSGISSDIRSVWKMIQRLMVSGIS